MNGDFSDLMVQTFISVAREETELEGKFWIAKVEEILERSENNIPTKISILWYTVRSGQDPWKGKYLPEVVGYEKRKSGTRGKTNRKPIWSTDVLDLSETTIFAYNFQMSKNDILYKKTIDRIKIRMTEYLEDLKTHAKVNPTSTETSSEEE